MSFALTHALCVPIHISEKFLDDVFIRQRRNPEDSKHPICKMFNSPLEFCSQVKNNCKAHLVFRISEWALVLDKEERAELDELGVLNSLFKSFIPFLLLYFPRLDFLSFSSAGLFGIFFMQMYWNHWSGRELFTFAWFMALSFQF